MNKIGFLGGGQLARMLVLAAHPLGLEPHVLSKGSDDPAAQVTSHWLPGSIEHLKDTQLTDFAKRLDLITFESEFFDSEILNICLKNSKAYIFPSLHALASLQDRKNQKDLLKKIKVPTAAFIPVSTKEDLKRAVYLFKGSFVLKLRTGGYDGKGTYYYRSHQDDYSFQNLIDKHPQGFIAEAFIKFKRECAVMLFRSRNGSTIHFPLVQTKQVDSRCDWVKGPIQHKKFISLVKKLFLLLDDLNYVGAIGFEIFDTGSELLINEVASRVHNSGHFSQNALSSDQFTLHLLCGLGAQLKKPQLLAKSFAMVNLIGSGNALSEPKPGKAHLHWYGKSQNHKGRKMGHLNLCGLSQSKSLQTLLKEREKLKL